MKRAAVAIGIVGAVIVLACGCQTTKAKSDKGGGIVGGPIPESSPFAKIQLNMPEKQVYDLIGSPSDTKVYVTGKSWVPFYYGSDTARTEILYKGQGRITLTGGGGFGSRSQHVYRIVYDPKEDGYAN